MRDLVIRSENMNDFLKNTSFGKDLKKVIQRTSKIVNGERVFKINDKFKQFNKGDQIYIDSKDFSHLEVFDKNNIFRFVMNLDGSVNEVKTKLGDGRKLFK